MADLAAADLEAVAAVAVDRFNLKKTSFPEAGTS